MKWDIEAKHMEPDEDEDIIKVPNTGVATRVEQGATTNAQMSIMISFVTLIIFIARYFYRFGVRVIRN